MMRALLVVMLGWGLGPSPAAAHDGPPFPIVTDREAGPYVITVWTDPDTTDDGSAGGQFWVQLALRDGDPVADGTTATIAAASAEAPGRSRSVPARPVDGDIGNQFAAIVLDREGRFRIDVAVQGPAGDTSVRAVVDATYDLRPPFLLLPLYLMPFALVGMLWTRLLLRRRRVPAGGRAPAALVHAQRSGLQR